MILEEVERACKRIAELAEDLMQSHSKADAMALQAMCRGYSNQMRGRFGNVGEQLARISDATSAYKKHRLKTEVAKSDLHQACTRMRMAIRIHR
jgi:hypothetical protein